MTDNTALITSEFFRQAAPLKASAQVHGAEAQAAAVAAVTNPIREPVSGPAPNVARRQKVVTPTYGTSGLQRSGYLFTSMPFFFR